VPSFTQKVAKTVQVATTKVHESGSALEIMCRAFGNRPLRRNLITQLEGAVEVANPETGSTGLFPERDVYKWDRQLANKINGLLDAGDDSGAERLWVAASPFRS
jgi:hypothetical protein